jgi:flagella synthesis protein FlgN
MGGQMTQTALTQETLLQHIGQDIDACRNLLQLLNQEREALKSRDLTALEDVIQSKSANLLHLEQSAKQRSTWIAGKVNPNNPAEAAWQTLLRSHAPHVQKNWDELRELLQECQEQNEINGKLLARNQQVFSRLLDIVRGKDENGPLYTAKGGRGAGLNPHKLGEA